MSDHEQYAGMNDLNSMRYDILREVGNIGAGNATTALSKLVNTQIDIGVPSVRLCDFSQMVSLIGEEEEVAVGILLMLKGDINGMMMFILKTDVASTLVNIMGLECDGTNFDEMQLSAIQEVGNIITGAYLCSLSDLTRLTIDVSVPLLQIDMVGSLLSVPAIEFGKLGDKVLLIETKFDDERKKANAINGYYILIPDIDSYQKILDSLGM